MLLVAIRLLAVSAYDLDTAFSLLRTQGTGAVVLGTLLPVVAMIPLITLMVLLTYVLWYQVRTGAKRHKRAEAISAGLGLLALLTTPWVLAAGLFLLTVMALGVAACMKPAPPRRLFVSILTGAGALTLLLIVTRSIFSSQPWLPREAIVSEKATTVGYVLEHDDEYIVLTDTPRGVFRVPGVDSRRFVCSEAHRSGSGIYHALKDPRPVLGLPLESAVYPRCPTRLQSTVGDVLEDLERELARIVAQGSAFVA